MLNKMKMFKKKDTPSVSMSPNENGGMDYVITLRNIIMNTDMYAMACDTLLNATDNDTVLIIINTPGGCVTTSMCLLHAMMASKATVITRAVGMVASCGAIIWSHGKKLEACKFTKIMFHGSSGGYFGTTKDMKDYSIACEFIMKELLQVAVDKNILTQQQFDDIFETKQDLYLSVKDLENNNVEFSYA